MSGTAQKHMLARKSEQYGDYALTTFGTVSFAALVHAIVITIFPDLSGGPLFDMAAVFLSVGGATFTFGGVGAAASGALAYGTNQVKDAALDLPNSWRTVEGACAIIAVALPLSHDVFVEVSNLTAGEPVIQGTFLVVYSGAMYRLTDL